MRRIIFAALCLLVVVACAPALPGATPGASDVLNSNPNLERPQYSDKYFDTAKWGKVLAKQYMPDGYELYERSITYPWDILWGGGSTYTFYIGGRNGHTGMSFVQTLAPGEYIVYIYGHANCRCRHNEVNLQATIWSDDFPGVISSNVQQFRANGPFTYELEFEVPAIGNYHIAPHWHVQWLDSAEVGGWLAFTGIELKAK
jgi:hypothetical protein